MKYYFETKDSAFCYTAGYFQEMMKENGTEEMSVYEAKPEKIEGVFWCKEFCNIGETGDCGKQCPGYSPRNGRGGCCWHYSKRIFQPGEQIIIHLGASQTKKPKA